MQSINMSMVGFLNNLNDLYLRVFQVLALLRYPRYLLLCRNLFKNEGEVLIEEIFKRGRVCAFKAVCATARKVKASGLGN